MGEHLIIAPGFAMQDIFLFKTAVSDLIRVSPAPLIRFLIRLTTPAVPVTRASSRTTCFAYHVPLVRTGQSTTAPVSNVPKGRSQLYWPPIRLRPAFLAPKIHFLMLAVRIAAIVFVMLAIICT